VVKSRRRAPMNPSGFDARAAPGSATFESSRNGCAARGAGRKRRRSLQSRGPGRAGCRRIRSSGPETCFSAPDAASCTTRSRRCTHSWPYAATLAPGNVVTGGAFCYEHRPPQAPKAINPRDRALCLCHGLCDVRARGRRDTHHHVGSAGRIRCCTNHRARSRPVGRRHDTRHNACPSASRAPAGRASRSAGLKHTPATEQPRRAGRIRPEAEEHCQYLFARRIRVAQR